MMGEVVALARMASSETDFTIVKSSTTGETREYRIASMFIMNAIRTTLPEESDVSRFSVVRTLPIPQGDDGRLREKKMREICGRITPEFGDRLFARMYHAFPRLLSVFKEFRTSIAMQSDNRTGDTYGMLLAGWWVALHDGVPTTAEIEEAIASLQLKARDEEEDRQPDHVVALEHLLDRTLRIDSADGPRAMTVRQIVALCRQPGADAHVNAMRNNLVLSGMYANDKAFYLRMRNPELADLYRTSKWGAQYAQAFRACPEWKSKKRMLAGMQATWLEVPYELSFGAL